MNKRLVTVSDLLKKIDGINDEPPHSPDDDDFKQANRVSERVKDYFQGHFGVLMKRVIGFGGHGVITLWEQFDRSQEHKHMRYFVVKTPIDKYQQWGFQQEWICYKTMEGAEHIPQMIDLTRPLPTADAVTGVGMPWRLPPKTLLSFLTTDQLIIEYMQHGDLNQFIIKMNQNAELYHQDRKVRMTWETIQDRPPERIVHFDIDAKNVFVGDLDPNDDEHRIHPKLKLGDFGNMTDIPDNADWAKVEGYRQWGKQDALAPEQFDKNTPVHPDSYHVHTNIWGIGYTMCELMTRCRMTRQYGNRLAAYRTCPDEEIKPGVRGNLGWTFGWMLLDKEEEERYFAFERPLRVLARCLQQHPPYRPTLEELVEACERAIQEGDQREAEGKNKPGEIDRHLEQFVKHYFRDAPDGNPDPLAAYWTWADTARGDELDDVVDQAFSYNVAERPKPPVKPRSDTMAIVGGGFFV